MKNILIVAHKFLPQMDDELIRYLNSKNYPNVLHIYHSFSDSKDRKSFFKRFKNGKLVEEKETGDHKRWPEPLLYLKELWFTIFWILKTRIIWDDFIGMDGLCTNFGLFLRYSKKVKKVIYWAVDFVPEKRFSSFWKNRIYELINTQGLRNANEMWDLSPRMKEARKKYLGIVDSDYKQIRIVPFGMWTSRIKTIPFKKCQQKTVVFMGHLLPKQGVQLIIKSLPKIVKKVPKIQFKIIGEGPYEHELKKLVADFDLQDRCQFLGKIEDNVEMEKEIANSAVAVAPYIKELDTWTYFADPGKVKTYLACGVPVLLTDIPWNTSEILKNKCGFVIEEDEADISKKVIELLNGRVNEYYRTNAARYAKSFDYQSIFKSLGY